MAKRTRIEPVLFLCPICKKNYFSFIEKVCCPGCEVKMGKKNKGERAE